MAKHTDSAADVQADLDRVLADTIDFAKQLVAAHTGNDGPCFLMGGEKHQLNQTAPQWARNAAAYLTAVTKFSEAGEAGDLDAASRHSLLAGMLTPEIWLAADKGKSYQDIMASIKRQSDAQSQRRQGQGDLSGSQWRQVVDRVNTLQEQRNCNRTEAAKLVHAELLQGAFGETKSVPDVDTIRRKRPNQSRHNPGS